MTQMYRTLCIARIDEGVLSVVIDASPMNLIGPELVRDMRFVARENAVLGQIEVGVGTPLGASDVQHLARLLERGRAMEVILGASDFNADEAERYGWVNRTLPDAELDAFVARLARRIASFPADAVRSTKQVLNELALPRADRVHADARRFQQLVRSDTVKSRLATLFTQGLQTRGPLELDLGDRLESLWQKKRNRKQGFARSRGRARAQQADGLPFLQIT